MVSSVHVWSKSGTRKSNASAAKTTIVATINVALTSLFGSGRAHACPSAQARRGAR